MERDLEVTFLGTGAAWGLPELGCRCKVCNTMRARAEERTRTCLLLRGMETLLVDCGPDIRKQLAGVLDTPPHAILLTHAHGDHFLGLDELVVFRRCTERESWRPIPIYATEETWSRVEQVFGYLLGNLLEKRVAQVGRPLKGIETNVLPFATDHGDVARGSVGYIVEGEKEGERRRLMYTSDFKDLPQDPPTEDTLDVLVIQSHWIHEPEVNRPSHMSYQRGLQFIQRWGPERTYLVHLSEEYPIDGDPYIKGIKGTPPRDPLLDPRTGLPYPAPLCQEDWQRVVTQIAEDRGIAQRPIVAKDGLTIDL